MHIMCVFTWRQPVISPRKWITSLKTAKADKMTAAPNSRFLLFMAFRTVLRADSSVEHRRWLSRPSFFVARDNGSMREN
jgi:hypothetical protein